MKSGLDIGEAEKDGVKIVMLSGSVDAVSANVLRSRVGPLCEQENARILLDCAGLTYLNSMCMGQFAAFDKICSMHGGKLALCSVDSTILDVIKLLKLDKVLRLCDSRDEALMMLSSA